MHHDRHTSISKPERATQDRVIDLFTRQLGYRFLGDWSKRPGNHCVEEDLLTASLARRGHRPAQISAALHRLRAETLLPEGRTLYAANQAVYQLLRYGIAVKVAAGQPSETVHLVDWAHPEANDFALAEEVTLRNGGHERRPDLVLYLNGIAVGVLELKNSRVGLGEGIRQSLSNQSPEFNAWFFTTMQLVMAGNDTEGLRYGTLGTPEKHFLTWKEDEADHAGYKLDKYLRKLCDKARLLELMHDFVLFDGGVKKLPRVHQYFGIKAAQAHVRQQRGGIIWHTQGAGKSILMVLLARWILESRPAARVVVITDRDELDRQIERVFTDAGETIRRSRSGRDLLDQLAEPNPRLLCSLVHKFGRRDVDDLDVFLRDLTERPRPVHGEIIVFVDECHRTQGGKLHRLMKAMMPGALFIGFTGTPLLKADAQTSREVFGGYIHTYKFAEAVEDGVVLDLVYEARDIDQKLLSTAQIDQWFEARTRGLNDWQKDELKKHWGTMQKVLSARARMDRVVADIVFDFAVRPRLSSERGNAILVASSIHEACKYFELFGRTMFRGRCAVVTSYNPQASDVSKEETGAHTETDRQFVHRTYTELLRAVPPSPGMTRTETYEQQVKALFIKSPAQMKLLIVVDKLLTGFDAPPCTCLYIDKSMQDHGLFQAICRTNRLDGEDKDFGHIVDYKDLFKKVEKAIAVYTAEVDHGTGGTDPQILVKDRLEAGRERLDDAIEALALLCEPVHPPKDDLAHIRHFCGNTEIADDLKVREPYRMALYKAVVALVRAYANLADDLEAAGYTPAQIVQIKALQKHYLDLREMIRHAAGETLDLKPFEADMRHLIDTYIEAQAPRKISPFDGIGLLDLIVRTGISDAIAERLAGLQGHREAIAETIENNVRSKILKEQLTDPAYFETMSALLDEIIRLRKARAIEYEDYLARIADVARQVSTGQADDTPAQLATSGQQALYSNLKALLDPNAVCEPAGPLTPEPDAALEKALQLDATIKARRPDGWRGVKAKEQMVKQAMFEVLRDVKAVTVLFPIVVAQKEY
ncbi:type I restriction-modification system restriction subunit [Sphaerotilus natans subsp. natans DSM 6575]|uniref:Type I restriction enzyme endonuclease subunit n=1 Tax=Sphaerotilus natans subsp. natans DSM 6575 TaxID=1286631 RepID=A0A059KKN5_9BURK|nr:HsdR family type I site-specific deoxyribonuclease [Sphaerotilus natans]KDB51673.1 type I restriction-modification system restriction subunit [Sphaerotilus natans subsp. natans DSM 6575]SIS04234.1 type I restriction enzyme, R subunit [Sphaerotilus natans]